MSHTLPSRSRETTQYGDPRGLDEEIAVSLVTEIASSRGEHPTETPLRLHEYVDPEALDQLLAHACGNEDADWEFSCTVEGATVTVRSDGTVTVD